MQRDPRATRVWLLFLNTKAPGTLWVTKSHKDLFTFVSSGLRGFVLKLWSRLLPALLKGASHPVGGGIQLPDRQVRVE